MKYIELNDLDKLPGLRIKKGDSFRFRCHPDIDCFNKCCRNLNLFLYPSDILRLKKNLGISSDEFLDGYVDVVLRSGSFFPAVLLRMALNDEKTCPFLTQEGCSVYPDRPGTCRSFPVEQGILYDTDSKKDLAVNFFRPPGFCLGQHEQRSLTVASWSQDQDADTHQKMTIRWAELMRLFQSDPWGAEGPQGPRAKMAFMATYNIDRFREFVFNSTFRKRYKIKPDLLKKLKRNETELMMFGFAWVKFFLWGIESKKFRVKK